MARPSADEAPARRMPPGSRRSFSALFEASDRRRRRARDSASAGRGRRSLLDRDLQIGHLFGVVDVAGLDVAVIGRRLRLLREGALGVVALQVLALRLETRTLVALLHV